MFSVIITAYNSEKWIEKSINSLIQQSYGDWECIIVENGSKDSTKDIILNIKDKRFNVYNLEITNKSSALNFGIIKSNFDWISILDSDDLWTKNKLELQNKYISLNNDVDILGTQLKYIDEFDKEIMNSPILPISHEKIVENFNLNQNSIANSSAVYKKKIHNLVGYYDVELNGVEDYDFWKKCVKFNLNFYNLSEKCLLHRIHNTSNFNSKEKQKHLKNFIDNKHKII